MGALLTRARYRYLQREFVRADEQGRGYLMPEEVYVCLTSKQILNRPFHIPLHRVIVYVFFFYLYIFVSIQG